MSHQRRLRLRLSSTNSQVQSAEAHWRIRAKRIAGEQLCCAGKDGKENLLQPVGWTRPFRFDPVGVLAHTQHSGGLCQG